MKIVFCWPLATGYISACWRELAAREGIDLFVLAFGSSEGWDSAFDISDMMEVIPHRLLTGHEQTDAELIQKLVLVEQPDVVSISGWFHSAYRDLVFDPAFVDTRFILSMDNPRRYTLRQTLAKFKLRRFLRRIDSVFVPGERSWQLAKFFGMEEGKIKRGCTHGVDFTRFSPVYNERMAVHKTWPRRFLFVGRYVDEIKAISVLLDAYEKYRSQVTDPWPFSFCGMGPMAERIRRTEGAEDHGFQQPDSLKEHLRDSGVLLLTSYREAWGLTILEGCAAGLPVISSEACGATVELTRPFYNGLITPTGNMEALTQSMLWMHNNREKLPEMGRRSIGMAAPYSAECWADRVLNAVEEIL